MRLHRDVATLAAVLSFAGISTPAAYAFANRAPASEGQSTAARVHHQSSNASDWLIAHPARSNEHRRAAANRQRSRHHRDRRCVAVLDPSNGLMHGGCAPR